MYEEYNAHIPDVDAYLAKIGLNERPEPTVENLDRMIWAHQCRIPFETLDMTRYHVPVTLEIEKLYQKMVVGERGGCCHEQNALFCQLLKDLGYDADSVFCRIRTGMDFIMICTHRCILVDFGDETRFCDVGFGGPLPAKSFPLIDGYTETVGGETFTMRDYDELYWELAKILPDGTYMPLQNFQKFRQPPEQFIAVNYYCSESPDSIFRQFPLVNLRTEDGALSLVGDRLTVHSRGEREIIEIKDDEMFDRILTERFGMTVPDR